MTHPVTTIRSSGTIVSATVSLGYEVSRSRVRELLLEAARATGLSEPFVQVKQLGDYSVTYRVAGLLTEVKQLISTRSRLRGKMIDALHGHGVEIVSPTFMNQRVFPEGRAFVPRTETSQPDLRESSPEAMVFDKADRAESLESLRQSYKALAERLQALADERGKAKTSEETARLDAEIRQLTSRKERLQLTIESREEQADSP